MTKLMQQSRCINYLSVQCKGSLSCCDLMENLEGESAEAVEVMLQSGEIKRSRTSANCQVRTFEKLSFSMDHSLLIQEYTLDRLQSAYRPECILLLAINSNGYLLLSNLVMYLKQN